MVSSRAPGLSGHTGAGRADDADGAKDDRVRVHLISLGCPKNLVDSEMILGGLGAHGLIVTSDADDADIVVVNTCGFVESAKEESIQTILEACELKRESAAPKSVVVAGCLGQRYGEELRREIPELDAIVGLGEYQDLGATLLDLASARRAANPGPMHFRVSDPTRACQAEVGRFRLTPRHYAYLRISEGCDNPCTFCAIPSFRGRFRSKPIPMIIEEARELAASGARELVLISQDTTSYGVDLDGTFALPSLLEALAGVDGVDWIRVLYAYPAYTTDAMIDAIASIPKVTNYLDIPLQHIADGMLRRMGRRMNEAKTRALLDRLRERIPGLILRTTFIVGFPGETEAEFEQLEDFVREFRFERLGVFTFSPEDGTPSATFADPIDEATKAERLERLMLAQQEVAFEHNRARRDEETDVIIDRIEVDEDGHELAIGRSYGEAPEIDPEILISLASPSSREPRPELARGGFREIELAPSRTHLDAGAAPIEEGAIIRARIVGSRDYDLLAVLARPALPSRPEPPATPAAGLDR